MELDELKIQLRQKLDADQSNKSTVELTSLLKKKAHSVIYKLQRSLWFEIIMSFLFIIGFAYVALFSSTWAIRVYFSIFTVFGVLFVSILIFLQRKITQLSRSSLPIRNNLEQVHSIISEYVKRYFQLTMGLIPVCIALSFWLGYTDHSYDLSSVPSRLGEWFSSPKQVYIFLAIYVILFTVGIYYFTRWYLKKLYGNYLKQLQGHIEELGAV